MEAKTINQKVKKQAHRQGRTSLNPYTWKIILGWQLSKTQPSIKDPAKYQRPSITSIFARVLYKLIL
jgi:hypothetical protein